MAFSSTLFNDLYLAFRSKINDTTWLYFYKASPQRGISDFNYHYSDNIQLHSFKLIFVGTFHLKWDKLLNRNVPADVANEVNIQLNILNKRARCTLPKERWYAFILKYPILFLCPKWSACRDILSYLCNVIILQVHNTVFIAVEFENPKRQHFITIFLLLLIANARHERTLCQYLCPPCPQSRLEDHAWQEEGENLGEFINKSGCIIVFAMRWPFH